jgi:hypothetical protein
VLDPEDEGAAIIQDVWNYLPDTAFSIPEE